jgi:hypothetical protein
MDIFINGRPADIKAENEKTVGEILSALDSWLYNSGHRLSGLDIDGETVDIQSVETAFMRGIESVNALGIYTSPLHELSQESLVLVLRDIDEYEKLSFSERSAFLETWLDSPQSRHLSGQMPDFFSLCEKTFSGTGAGADVLRSVAQERLREITGPAEELSRMESVVSEVCARLADIGLDTQTGKDARAAETVQMFTGVAEKIIRICNAASVRGINVGNIDLGEFRSVLDELLAAYSRTDIVLVSDLAEYELAPRLRSIYTDLKLPLETAIIGGEDD